MRSTPAGAGISIGDELALLERGSADIFPAGELAEKLAGGRSAGRPLRVKLGVDPTATELHLGHVLPALKLRQFQELGHQAVLVIGDYTAMIGDPTGRNKARPQLTHAAVMENCRTYQEQLFRILDPQRTEVVYNGHWFSAMGFTDVIQLLTQITLARMLEAEHFAERYRTGSPIGLHELVYPLMQGYDSAMIRADVELGGTDQKFNILVGRDIQREMGQSAQVGVCMPILIGLDGREKMSKSLGNAIALTDPPQEMFGKVMSIPDDLMADYFELLTEVPQAEIDLLFARLAAGELHPRELKKRLGREVTARFHTAPAAAAAETEFERVFGQRALPEQMPIVPLGAADLENGRIWIVRLIVKAGLASSNAEARRLIQQGGVRLDGSAVTDVDCNWSARDGAVLQVGRRRFARVRLG